MRAHLLLKCIHIFADVTNLFAEQGAQIAATLGPLSTVGPLRLSLLFPVVVCRRSVQRLSPRRYLERQLLRYPPDRAASGRCTLLQ